MTGRKALGENKLGTQPLGCIRSMLAGEVTTRDTRVTKEPVSELGSPSRD